MIGAARSFHGDAGFFFNAVFDTVDVVSDVFYRFMKNVISVWNPGIAVVRIVVALLIAGVLMLVYGVFKGGGKITVIAYSLVWFLASFLGCTLTSLFGSIIWHDHSVNMFYATLIGAVLSAVGVAFAGGFIESVGEDEEEVSFSNLTGEIKPGKKEEDVIYINIPEKIKSRIAFFTDKRNIPSIAVGAVGFVCFLVSLLSGKLTLYAELRNKTGGIEYKEIASAGIDISTASILTSMQLVVSGWVIYSFSAAEGFLKRKLNVRLSAIITAFMRADPRRDDNCYRQCSHVIHGSVLRVFLFLLCRQSFQRYRRGTELADRFVDIYAADKLLYCTGSRLFTLFL